MLRALITALLALIAWLFYLPVLVLGYFLVMLFGEIAFRDGWQGLAALAGVAVAFSSGKYLLLLAWSSLAYRRQRLGHVTLLYPRSLERALNLDEVRQGAEESAVEVKQSFGNPLLRPVVILPTPTLLMHLRCGWAGFALPYTVVINPVSVDSCYGWRELLRHELAHTATYRLLPLRRVPALLLEGLAVHWMRTECGFPIDAHALAILSEELCEPLFVLDDKTFYQRRNALRNYILAGSFTGHLVRCMGWEQFRRFYARTSSRRWMQDVQRMCGRSVMELEREWRQSLACREDLTSYLPQLRLYWKALRLVHHWRWEEAVVRAEEYLQQYGWDILFAGLVSEGYFVLRQWEHCAEWNRRLAEDSSAVNRLNVGLCWLYIGCCHDLQGKRAEAMEAYRRALQELPVPAWNYESTHTLAKRHLKTAFGEKQFAQYIRYRIQTLFAGMEA
ncbi:MAG: hypothetical protein RMM06_10445 [Armatimonadota bacterium]|nr:hypothetical protein [Armatimonadota bacterium]